MHLTTHELLVPVDAAMNHVEPVNTAGWSEVCKGLYGILAGYLLIFGSIIGAVIVAVVVFSQLAVTHSHEGAGTGLATLIIGAIVVALLILGGYALIIRSLWRCLRSAPEHCGAKWWMFAAILCIVAGPAMGTVSSLVIGNDKQTHIPLTNKSGDPLTFREALAESKKAGATAAPMKIVSSVVGLLSQVFFILFLRSVAVSFNDGFRARMAEMYLLLTATLFAGLVGLIIVPEYFLTKPLLLLALGACPGRWMGALRRLVFRAHHQHVRLYPHKSGKTTLTARVVP